MSGTKRNATATETIDLRGKVCPYPTMDTNAALGRLGAGEILEVISDYYPARQTIPKLVADLGCSCELVEDSDATFRLRIVKGS